MLAGLAPSISALLLLTAAGAGLQALCPSPLERGRVARAGLAYLLGLAWTGFALWALGFLAGAPLDQPLVLAVVVAPLVAAAAVAVRRRSWGGLEQGGGAGQGARRWFGVAAATVLAIETVALLAHATAEPVTDFDGRMTWGTQARYLQASESVLPEVLRDERAYVIHPRYPILLPLLQVATVELAGTPIDGFGVRPLYALFLPAFAAALWPTLRRAGGLVGAAGATLLLFSAPIVLRDRDAGPLGTYSDFPLAAFLGVGFALLLHPRTRREPWRGWVAGLLLAAAAGSKNEGMLLAVAALALAALVSPRPGGRWRGSVVRAGATVALALVLIVAWRSQIPNRNDEGYFETWSLATLISNLPARTALVAGEVFDRSLDRDQWGWLFWVAPPILILGARGLRRRACRAAALLVAVELALALAAYSMVGDPGIVGVTWNRFLLQIAAPIAILLAAACSAVSVAARQNAFWSRPPQY